MSTVIVDAAMREKLIAAGDEIEFRDETGKLVARFVKPTAPFGYIIDGVLPSSEELERIQRESPRVSTDQVMERIRQLREKLS